MLSFSPFDFFQLENLFFVNAGSALDEVSIPLWRAFKQVWQQAASLLSSWCNHLNRSNHAVWNDLFVAFLFPKVFEIFRLVWTIWYVYKDLIRRAELRLCRFQFASYCCRWLQIIFISGFFGSYCFFDYTRLCVTNAWLSVPYLFSTPHARSQQQTEILIHLLKKLDPVNDIRGVLYLVDPMWIFSPRIWKELQF